MLLVEKDIAQSLMGRKIYLFMKAFLEDQKYAWKKSPQSFTTNILYHKNRKFEKVVDFQWINFPILLQEFKENSILEPLTRELKKHSKT